MVHGFFRFAALVIEAGKPRPEAGAE